MKISNRQTRNRLRAQLSTLQDTLEKIPEFDLINRATIESDIKRLVSELESVKLSSEVKDEEHIDDNFIELAISGDPVIAQKGIDISFAGKMLSEFQNLVSSIVASRQGKTAISGPVKHYRKSNLHVTGIVRGSFGFVVEPIAHQLDMFELETSKAIDIAADLLIAISEPNEKLTDHTSLADASERVLLKLNDFMKHLSSANATLNFVTPKRTHNLDETRIKSSIEKLMVTKVDETIIFQDGILNGILPESHKFELQISEDETIYGSIIRKIPAVALKAWQGTFLHQEVRVELRKRILFRNGEIIRTSYSLLSID